MHTRADDANYYRILFAVTYWYVWTVIIPKLQGYRLEEETLVLKDGTSVTKLVHVSI